MSFMIILARRAVVAAAVSVAALSAPSIASAQEGVEVGAIAPAAALETLDGKAANLSQYVGKVPVIMEFWATWCENCKELEPAILALTAKYKQVQFVGVAVSVNQSAERVKAYVDAHKLPGVQFYDRRGNATGAYDPPVTSYVLVIDRTGKVVYSGSGGKQPKLEEAIKKVL
jgi:thiol-disulfide isomerase/thioredoxin